MQVPVSNTANAITILSDATPTAGIRISGLTPNSTSALYLGNRESGGWERFIRFYGKLQHTPFEQLFLHGDEPHLSEKGAGNDIIVLVHTGYGVKDTQVAQHGVYAPNNSSAEQIDAGTVKRSGKVTSREELWLLPEDASIIVLTATGRKVRLTNQGGKAYDSSVEMDELKELVTVRTLDIIEQTIERDVDKTMHWLIGHASEHPESFSPESRQRFRSLVTKYRDQANEGVNRRLEGLYKRFYDGRFGGRNDNVVSLHKAGPKKKGSRAEAAAKKAARAELDRQRTIATKGKSPQPPNTFKKPKVKA